MLALGHFLGKPISALPRVLLQSGWLSTREPGSLSLGQGPETQGRGALSRSPQHAGFVVLVLSSVLPMTLPGADHCLPEPGGPMTLTVHKPGLAHGCPRRNCQPLPRYTGADWKCLFLYASPEAVFGAMFCIQSTIICITSPDSMKVSCRFVN